MDSLVSLMSAIDLNSKSIPEGDYLEMCNCMKELYKVVPRATSPDVVVLPRINVHRSLPDSDTESDEDDDIFVYRPVISDIAHHINLNTQYTRETINEIKRIESRLKYLKLKQRITASIKRDAVRERAQQLGLRLRCLTIEELNQRGHIIQDERSFYKSYMERQNDITRNLITDLRRQLFTLNIRHENLHIRYNELISMVPR
jgi:hypothetical protein